MALPHGDFVGFYFRCTLFFWILATHDGDVIIYLGTKDALTRL